MLKFVVIPNPNYIAPIPQRPCRESVGVAEPGKLPFTWPVLTTDDERWAIRVAIDAVVAQAYGFTHDQYAQILYMIKIVKSQYKEFWISLPLK